MTTNGTQVDHRALTLVAPILDGHVDELEKFLLSIGDDIRGNPHISFDALATVHFMRWVIVRRDTGTQCDYLLFESNYDGTLDEHLDDLLRVGLKAVHDIYRHCEGYDESAPGDGGALHAYLRSRAIPYAAFYQANPHKSARRIRLEAKVRDALESFLQAQPGSFRAAAPTGIYARIREHLDGRGLLTELEADDASRPEREEILPLALRLVPSLLPVALFSPVLLPALLLKELTDEEWGRDGRLLPGAGATSLKNREDRIVQNQLSHVVAMKPGSFRLFALKRVMSTIELLARRRFNQGELGGIPTIHFARWAFLQNDEFLFFFSNYDGSWENYLGDFIDIAAVGLTSVWSNTIGFPKTLFLVSKGARDEQRFKSWTRAHQVHTQVWYSAYPTLTVKNIVNNELIANGLQRVLTKEADIVKWLERI